MAKDGVVSIAIDYKNELNQMIRDYESALTEMASNDKLSKGMKSQFDSTIAELKRFKADMEKSFSDLSIGKVDKNSFKAFKQTVNKNFESVRAEIDNLNLAVSTINSQIKILGGDLDISKISSQFKDFQDYVQNINNAIDTMIKKLDGQGISLMSFDNSAVNQAKSQIKEINKLLKGTYEFSDKKGSKYELFDIDQAQAELDALARDLKNTLDLIEKSESELSNFDKGSIGFEKTTKQIDILKLKAANLYDSIEQLQTVSEIKEFGGLEIKDDSAVEKYFKYLDIIPDELNEIRESAIKTREELEKIVTSASFKTASAKISDKLNPNSAELVTGVTIETTSSELWKKLSPIIEDLQNILNKNPVVAPVKLVVAPNAVSSEKNDEIGTISKSYSKKYQKELAKTGQDAVIDLEGVYKKTFTSIMDEAVSYSKETISKIQNIFESSPIKLHFDFNEEEFKKISDTLLSSDSGKKIDITGQIAESKKEVNELAEKLAEVNELLNSADSKDFSFKGFDKFAEEISKSLNQLTELQSMLKTLQNIESTLARASGVSSVTDIEAQWQNVSKLIENSIKLDGTFRKNANVDKLASEYNKYLNMGGTNELSSIGKVGKLENSKNIIDAILLKVKELNSQKVDTSSVDKADDELKSVSSTLDDVISRLDHMINLIRDIGNTFWKMFKDASVSDIDKQWSSIESKFKSIADESGKINLSKQKKDIQELVEMYQKYTNAGGMNTPFDLTDNAETIKKMNKVYEQMNSKKDGTSVGSESKEFNKIESSVNTLTSAINTKTEAIKTEANTMELAARAEVKSIQKIIDTLNPLIEKIENIPELKIAKNDTTLPSQESNNSSENIDKKYLEGEKIRKNLYKINSEVGLTEEEFIDKLRQENEEVKNGNREFQERLALLKDGKVIASYFGDKASINISKGTIGEDYDKAIHTHSPLEGSSAPSFEDLKLIFDNNKSAVKEFVLFWNNEMRSLIAPGDTSMFSDSFKNLQKFIDAMSLLSNDRNTFSAYVNAYLSSIAEEAGLAYKQVDALNNELQQGRINSDDQKIIQQTMHQVTNLHASQNQEDDINNISERGKHLSNTFIQSNESAEKFEITVENLFNILSSLWDKIESNPTNTNAFQILRDEFSSLSKDNINNILYGEDMFFDADGDTNELKQIAQKIYDNYYLPLINGAKELQNVSEKSTKDAFPDSSTDTKPETEGMEQVEKATEEAVQAKKEFATANEGVQSSIDGSENPLKLEAELMEQIAKSARETADAKKEFVEANKQVEKSADDSNSELKDTPKKDKYAKRNKISEDDFLNDSSKYTSIANSRLISSGNTILGNTVNADLIDGLVKVTAKIKDADGVWKTFSARIDADGNMFNQRFKAITKGVNQLEDDLKKFGKDKVKSDLTDIQIAKYQELENAIKNYEKISKRIASNSAYDGDEKSASDLLDTINEIMGKTNGGITVLSNEQLNKAQNKLDNIDQTISDIKQKTNISEFKNLEKLKSSAINKLNPYTNDTKYTIDFINKVNNLQNQIANFNLSNQSDVDRLKAIDAEIKNIIKESNLLENKLVKQKSNLAEIVSQMKIFKSQNTNMSRSQKAELDQIINYAETMQRSGEEVASEVENIKVRFVGLKAEVNETGKAGKNFFDQIGNRLSDMNSKFVAQFLSWQDWIRYIQQGISTIRDLDEAMTEVRKVSSATDAQYESFQKTISSTAKEIASTNKELLNSSADFLRLGYSLDEASDLAKNATLFVNVGDGVDVNTATEDMITAMKAFDIQAKDSIKIVDDYNQIGNKFALSATDIGEAMKRSASALETGNNSFEESIALITAMNEIVQNSENTGNTLKVFSLRLRGAKAELEDMGEDTDGLCESSSKLREQLQALTGVDIMLNDNTFKSTTQIVKELGATWDKLSDSSQAAALELVAGKTRANNVAALLKNYKQIDNVLGSLEDAEGSALKENEAIVDSINGRIKTLSATAEEFWQKFINTDFVKNVVSLASDLLGLLTKIVDKFGTIPTLATAISAALSFKNVGINTLVAY